MIMKWALVVVTLFVEAQGLALRSRGALLKGAGASLGLGLLKPALPASADPEGAITKSGLRYKIDTPGTGPKPMRGQTAVMDYTLKTVIEDKPPVYVDGTKQTYPPRPVQFMLGVGAQIPGFDEAAMDMRVGEKRIVVVPPNLAYGKYETSNGLIPPDATLIYVLEMRSLLPFAPTPEQEKWIAENPLQWER